MRDNPARRLRNILHDTYKISGGVSVQRAWARFFDLDADDTVEVNRRLLQLVDLLREVKQKVEYINSPGTSIHLKALEQLEHRILPNNLSLSWNSVYTLGVPEALQFCEEVIDSKQYNEGIEDINLDEISSKIEDLKNEIQNSKVNYDLKEHISEILEDVKKGIKNYEILGNKGIQKPILCLIGTMVVNQTEVKENSTVFWEKAYGFVADSISILGFVSHIDKLPQLVEVVKGFLVGGGWKPS